MNSSIAVLKNSVLCLSLSLICFYLKINKNVVFLLLLCKADENGTKKRKKTDVITVEWLRFLRCSCCCCFYCCWPRTYWWCRDKHVAAAAALPSRPSHLNNDGCAFIYFFLFFLVSGFKVKDEEIRKEKNSTTFRVVHSLSVWSRVPHAVAS